MRGKIFTVGLAAFIALGVNTTPANATTRLPSIARYTDWYRDRTPTLRTPIRYGVQGHSVTTTAGTSVTVSHPTIITTISYLNGKIYSLHTYPLDRNMRAQWTTSYPKRGYWTYRRLETIVLETCIPSPYWWIDADCTTITYTENTGIDHITIK